jgi:energy-coupling factor transport system ATP-binding protein
MAMNPKVLILDEPTAGLDPAGRDKILGHIKKYHERTKNTILIVSHSMEDIAGFADRILVMNKAKLFCFDETEKVFARAEEISKIGLDVPQVTKIFLKLKEQGLDFGKDVYTMEYAKNLLLKKLSERGGV